MRIVALYKTLEGEEFVIPSIESIYNHVDKIIMVHSNISWNNENIDNTVAPIVEKWKSESDIFDKIINIYVNCNSQNEQYDRGIQYIHNNLECDYIMLIDTDEVWDEHEIIKFKEEVESNKGYDRYTASLYSYFKTPFLRISPPEPLHCTVFMAYNKNLAGYNIGIRGNGLKNYYKTTCKLHHFTYVRFTEDAIKRKFVTSHIGDNVKSYKWEEWKEKFWNKAPNINNFHPSVDYKENWKSLERINLSNLPDVFSAHYNEIISLFNNNYETDFNFYRYTKDYKELPYGELTLEDENILFKYSNGYVLEIGTFLGRSAKILSYKAKYVSTIDIFEYFNLIKDDNNKQHYIKLFNEYPHYYKDIKKKLSGSNIGVYLRYNKIFNTVIPEYNVIFLDGDHSEEGIRDDFNGAIHLLKKDGILILHDSFYNENAPHHGVYKFIENIPNYMKKIDEGGSCTVWKKII